MRQRTVAVIGHGMVGHRFVEALRARDTDGAWRIVVFGEETDAAYDRVGLSSYVGAWDRSLLALTGNDYHGADDPGVQSVTKVYNYYKKFGYKTVVMGASFRNIGEITELAGCDLLTIAPKLLAELGSTQAPLTRKLDPANAQKLDIKKLSIDKATFDKMHAEDRMATDKLKEGIDGFSKAIVDLEVLLEKRLSEIAEPATAAR